MVFCLKRSLLAYTRTSSQYFRDAIRSHDLLILHTILTRVCSFAFATIDPNTFEVKATSEQAQDLMQRIGGIRLLQPDIKIWIAIGGWAFSDADQPTAKTFTILSASKQRQKKFADSLISMMSTYGFDGVDIDWVSRHTTRDSGSVNMYTVSAQLLWSTVLSESQFCFSITQMKADTNGPNLGNTLLLKIAMAINTTISVSRPGWRH